MGEAEEELRKRNKVLQFRLIIKLKYTEANFGMLKYCQGKLGLGNVRINGKEVIFQIDDISQIAQIIPIFSTYPLLTTNMRSRFFFFSFCFNARSYITVQQMQQLKANFINLPPIGTPQQIKELAYFSSWLVGLFFFLLIFYI